MFTLDAHAPGTIDVAIPEDLKGWLRSKWRNHVCLPSVSLTQTYGGPVCGLTCVCVEVAYRKPNGYPEYNYLGLLHLQRYEVNLDIYIICVYARGLGAGCPSAMLLSSSLRPLSISKFSRMHKVSVYVSPLAIMESKDNIASIATTSVGVDKLLPPHKTLKHNSYSEETSPEDSILNQAFFTAEEFSEEPAGKRDANIRICLQQTRP